MRRRLWWVAVLLGLCCPALWAQNIQEDSGTISDRKTRGAFAKLDEHGLKLPSILATDKDIYILVRQSAGYVDVRLLAKTSVSGRSLAAALVGIGKDPVHRLPNPAVTYSDDDEFHAARAIESVGQFGEVSGSTRYSVGGLIQGLKAQGYQTHALLSVPRYASTESQATYTGENYQWWDISDASASEVSHVTVALPKGTPWLVAGFLLFVPFFGGLGLVLAQWVGQATHLSLERRRYLYGKVAIYPIFGAIVIHMPFALWLMRSPILRQVADLWFGSTTAAGTISPFIMVGPLVLMLILPLANKREKQLFGNDSVTPNLPPASLAEAERVKAANVRVLKLSLIPMALGMLLVFFGDKVLPITKSTQMIPIILGVVVMQGGGMLVRYLNRDALKAAATPPVVDFDLTQRLRPKLMELGKTLGECRIDESVTGRTTPSATFSADDLTISYRMREILTPTQLDFVVLREAAALKSNNPARLLMLILPISLLAILPMQLRLFGLVTPGEPWNTLMMFLPFLGFAAVFLVMPQVQQKKVLEADRLALLQSRDLKAAEGALRALTANSPLPYLEESPLPISTNPGLRKRLLALQQVAATLGLPR